MDSRPATADDLTAEERAQVILAGWGPQILEKLREMREEQMAEADCRKSREVDSVGLGRQRARVRSKN